MLEKLEIIVSTIELFDKVVENMNSNNMKMASMSDVGQPRGTFILTFIPKGNFLTGDKVAVIRERKMPNQTTASTNDSNTTGLNFDNIKDATQMLLKDSDPLIRMFMSEKTWSDMPTKEGKEQSELPIGPIALGIPVGIRNVVPNGFIRNEYKSGKQTIFNLKTGREVTYLDGNKL